MRIYLKEIILSLVLSLLPMFVCAEQVVIVHPSNTSALSDTDVANLYLAKTKTFPNGANATPLNLNDSSPLRSTFENSVVGRNESQMRAYWSRLLFTGKAVPIRQIDSDSQMVEAVASDPSAIGYVDKASVTDSVKVILSF